MIEFVLNHMGEVAFGLDLIPTPAEVLKTYGNRPVALHLIHEQAGDAQAPLRTDLFPLAPNDSGVDHDVFCDDAPPLPLVVDNEVALVGRFGVGIAGIVVLIVSGYRFQGHEDPFGKADLWGGEADAVGVVHGFQQIATKGLERGVEA